LFTPFEMMRLKVTLASLKVSSAAENFKMMPEKAF